MKVIITGGGTAGHVTPLIALASEIKHQQPDSVVEYIGQRHDPASRVVTSAASIDQQYQIFAGKFRRYHGVGLIRQLIDIKTNLLNLRDFIYFLFNIC